MLNNLAFARDNNYLWPPIADAVDIYLRRSTNPDIFYERIWRLIQIWEAIEVTLATAAISKLAERDLEDAVLRKCREYFYGTEWNVVNLEFRSSLGAADGSIDKWINILNEISKDENINDGYLKSLKDFLNKEEIALRPLIQVWSRACDVPSDALQNEKSPTKTVMRHINVFRNRFAHLPFPPDVINDLASSLENVTNQLFSISPLPGKHFDKDVGCSSPMTGAFASGYNLIRGTQHNILEQKRESIQFLFPCPTSPNNDSETSWNAKNLIYIDDLARPYIFSKIKTDAGTVEYVRYKAEANALISKDINIEGYFSRPTKSEYQKPELTTDLVTEVTRPESAVTENPETTFDEAVNANREGRYDIAIKFFERLKEQDPSYHIAWLNLGYAQREKAVRLGEEDTEAVELLTLSARNLIKATEHIDKEYQARAYYELSKTYFQLYKRKCDESSSFDKSADAALHAVDKSSDPKYLSWLEHINPYSRKQIRKNEETLTNPVS